MALSKGQSPSILNRQITKMLQRLKYRQIKKNGKIGQ